MESKDRRTTFQIFGVLNWEYEFRADTIWVVYEIGYKFRKFRFAGTFKGACEFLEEHKRPFSPPIIRN